MKVMDLFSVWPAETCWFSCQIIKLICERSRVQIPDKPPNTPQHIYHNAADIQQEFNYENMITYQQKHRQWEPFLKQTTEEENHEPTL